MDEAWPWPEELDGLLAAPDHHRVMFENDKVRVIETVIRAGDSVPLHCHRRATVTVVLSGSHFVARDENGELSLDTRTEDPPFEMPRVSWSDGVPAHSLENPTDEDIVMIGVEIKRPNDGPDQD